MAFPRLNALSFWLMIPAGILMAFSLLGGGFDTGWTVYPPLSAAFETAQMDLVLLGVYLAGLSSIIGGINILTTYSSYARRGWVYFACPFLCGPPWLPS